jgi:hypothetical protein
LTEQRASVVEGMNVNCGTSMAEIDIVYACLARSIFRYTVAAVAVKALRQLVSRAGEDVSQTIDLSLKHDNRFCAGTLYL